MEFKVGQTVLVRADFTQKDARGVGYTSSMESYRGKTVKIEQASSDFNRYMIRTSGGSQLWWNERQLAPIATSPEEAFNMLIRGEIDDKTYATLVKEVGNDER